MEALKRHRGIVMPLDRANVDTDAIIPAEYLKAVTRTGFADGLFTNWRYRGNTSEPDPEFVLNRPRYRQATILVAGANFGCGSSREHAPWALFEYGFRVLLAPSFADIFSNNCFNIGLLPITLDATLLQTLVTDIEVTEGYRLTIHLIEQTIETLHQGVLPFAIDSYRRESLLQGLDMIGQTLQYQHEIEAYERRRSQQVPWNFL